MDSIQADWFIEDEKLYACAVSTARLLRPLGECSGRKGLAPLRRSVESIRRTHEAVRRRYGSRSRVPAACEWLLDNWYLARRESLAAARELEQARRLRRCREGLLITELCRALLKAGAGAVTEERCRLFLAGFQSVTVLRRSELSLFPAALRAAALQELAAVCRKLQYAADMEDYVKPLEALFSTLRLLAVLDPEALLDGADVTGAVLAEDPSGEYLRMDGATRRDYLRRVEVLARRAGLEEHVYARRLIRRAREQGVHVGFLLFRDPSPRRGRLYIAANVLLSLSLSLLAAFRFGGPAAALLLLLPVSELVKSLLDFLLSRFTAPRRLPRMDPEEGVPPEAGTICVISALLTGPDSARALAERLEELRLASRREGRNLRFGLLADLPEAAEQRLPGDEESLEAARVVIRQLNRRYQGGFYLFTRPRRFDGERWSGRERKRGALLELASLLCDEPSALQVTGDRDALAGVRYILTLDSDTRLYPGAAGELIAAMRHPLNRPQVDERRGVVTRGHAVLHPRMETELASANATDFALIFAGPGGSDPYGALCGELYMDAFGSGGFAGKGLLDARALLQCTGDRFPEQWVLSHDALEGAFLRGGFVGDAAFSDAFPARPLAYYKRLHRWIRGDWQNLPWVFCRALPEMDRWRLFDSLRRSLLPPATLLAVLAGFFLPGSGLAVSAWAALLALLSRLLLSLAESGLRRRERIRLRRATRLLTGVGGAIVQSFLRLWLLPYEAWICLSAILTALWRMLVTHKRLLQWQTAAQSERSGGSLAACALAFWQSLLLGLALLLFSPVIIGRSAGLLWLLSPLTAAALALPAWRDRPLAAADRDYLLSAAGQQFRYYTQLCTPQEHHLPPDNYQEQPPVGAAHRTSPTNMGLCLASAVAARDLALTDTAGALGLIAPLLETMEALPRHLGHFYNWYDTRTLRPLTPPILSTVDSGNLCAALLVVQAALAEWGEDALAERAGALAEAMDFAPLYDKKRGLFYICYDPERERGSGGWYDLMASEAMLTSFLAIARGQAPEKHWRRLSRAQLQKDGYRGLASWTGTMFEYLMPALFLPLYRGSLLYESARFCLYVQKRRHFAGRPWGISESAYFSLDPAMTYRYKANGCGALALKRGQDADLVVAPYASFLALAVDPAAAVRNLRLLERCGALGRFGFLEALDFTPERCRRDEGEKVRCTMAHHVGMSILAAANALCEGSIRRRFFSHPAMAAHRLLLQERLPDSGAVLRRDLAEAPEKPPRRLETDWRLRGSGSEEHCCVLSNGAYHLLVSSLGRSSADWNELSVYGSRRLDEAEPGLCMSLDREADSLSLFPAEAPVLWELSGDQALWQWQREGLRCSAELFAAAGEAGECRILRLQPERDEDAALRLSFRALLALRRDLESHPAFWRLGVEAEYPENGLLLRRLARGGVPETWLCLLSSVPAQASVEGGRSRALADPLAALRLPLRLRAGTAAEIRLALCLGRSREEALAGAARILRLLDRGDMPLAIARRLGMDAAETDEAMALLEPIYSPLHAAAPRQKLWPYGLSGDLPLLCCEGRAVEALPLLRRFLLLKSCGVEAELVYLSDEQGEYRQPLFRRLREELTALGLEALIGSPGGVRLAPLSAAAVLKSRAAFFVGEPPRRLPPLLPPRLSAPRADRAGTAHAWEDGAFTFTVDNDLPARAWQLLLSNGRLGCIAAETGPAALWLDNARELRLLRPMEDLRAPVSPELLWAETPDGPVSLFAANDGLPCRVRYAPGLVCWEKELAGRAVRTELFLAPEDEVRLLLLRGAEGLRLHWVFFPVLSGGDASSLRCRREDGLFCAENPECMLPGLRFLAGSGAPADCRADHTPPAMHMSLDGEALTVLACGCCEAETLRDLCRPARAIQLLADSRAFWRSLLSRLRLETALPALDHYMNGWAAYQVLAGRLWGRSSLYQSGGAYGFRDQLQDGINLLPLSPDYARERILDACRHQYREGDVLHWWHPHPAGDKGVRTRCGDDLLWLVWALCEYEEATGDTALCDLSLPYLHSAPLADGERDRYETPERAEEDTVLHHAEAALDCCRRRGFGPHGLPWMGSGDWNDAMDAVEGESVWLGWFLAHCAGRFADLLDRLHRPGGGRWRRLALRLGAAADSAWNGRWYHRGYWPDGTPLGGEERLDALPQAWAVLSGCGAPDKAARALDAALARLVDREHRLIRLFDPPYGDGEPRPGYLVSYGRGFRENGGQYTHGALWLVLACLKAGRREEGLALMRMLLPEEGDLRRYEAEPFVLAADVSAAPGREGLAGWTWYTGSAGWALRVVLEGLLGLGMRNGVLRPLSPPALSDYRLRWTDPAGQEHRFTCRNGEIREENAADSG